MIIYKAVNKINGKIYIGKTTRELSVRLSEHKHEKRMPFSSAYQKYGHENFSISIIDTADTEEELNHKERKWIAHYESKKPNGYNITDGGEGTSGVVREDTASRNRLLCGKNNHMFGKRFTPEERKKFGQPGERNPMYGKQRTDEEKSKLSAKSKAAWADPEKRERMRLSMVGRKHKKPASESLRRFRSENMKRIWTERKAAANA